MSEETFETSWFDFGKPLLPPGVVRREILRLGAPEPIKAYRGIRPPHECEHLKSPLSLIADNLLMCDCGQTFEFQDFTP